MHLERRTETATATRFFPVCLSVITILAAIGAASASAETCYLSCPRQVLQLIDLNGDGDAMDFGEVNVFADALPANVAEIARAANGLYVIDAGGSAIIALQDNNGDGDAMDFGEMHTFAELDGWLAGAAPIGLAIDDKDNVYTLNTAGGRLLRLTDLNGDGDALDTGEVQVVAEDLVGAVAIGRRNDTSMLVAMSGDATPVKLLDDRNNDGDFFDFAENVGYAASFAPGFALAASDAATALLARNSDPRVLRLTDTNGDGDVMDFGEVAPYAQLALPLTAMAHRASTDVYIAAGSAAGTVYRLRDLNGDADAFDAGEVVVFASGLPIISGMAIGATDCLPGDLDGDGALDISDAADFVDVVLGLAPAELCRADLNHDGRIDGEDIAPFVQRMLE